MSWSERVSLYMGAAEHSQKALVLSKGRDTHSVGYFHASLFIREFDDTLCPDQSSLEALMKAAATYQLKNCSRVGAAVLGGDAKIYAAGEKIVGAAFNGEIFTNLSSAIEQLGVESSLAADFVDFSTSIHAECVALQACIDAGSRPVMLATTRCPCLACCRHIRLTGVRKVVYLSGKGFKSPSAEVLQLLRFALGGCDLELYEGMGGLE